MRKPRKDSVQLNFFLKDDILNYATAIVETYGFSSYVEACRYALKYTYDKLKKKKK